MRRVVEMTMVSEECRRGAAEAHCLHFARVFAAPAPFYPPNLLFRPFVSLPPHIARGCCAGDDEEEISCLWSLFQPLIPNRTHIYGTLCQTASFQSCYVTLTLSSIHPLVLITCHRCVRSARAVPLHLILLHYTSLWQQPTYLSILTQFLHFVSLLHIAIFPTIAAFYYLNCFYLY